METLVQQRESLSEPWRGAFTEAWTSYCGGDLGIGAVLFDPEADQFVSTGRNRVNQRGGELRTLSGNFMAHAEMNALAALDRFKADGLDLYTTLQPCLMCSATSVFMHVQRVFFASSDEFFPGISELWTHHPYSARNRPLEIGPLDGPIALFARLLPLSVQASDAPNGPVIDKARQEIPAVAELATSPEVLGMLATTRREGGAIEDALAMLEPLL